MNDDEQFWQQFADVLARHTAGDITSAAARAEIDRLTAAHPVSDEDLTAALDEAGR